MNQQDLNTMNRKERRTRESIIRRAMKKTSKGYKVSKVEVPQSEVDKAKYGPAELEELSKIEATDSDAA